MTTQETPTGEGPQFQRILGLRAVVLFGLAYMTPIIVLGIFGIIAEVSAGAAAGSYLLAAAAMLFTAYSYGRMAAAFPVAGSAYTYVRRAIDSRVGFLVGWAILLDYLFLPMVIWLIGAAYLEAEFPGVPSAVWILAFIALTTVLNVIGLRVADKANFVLMTFQVLVIVLFVGLSVGHVLDDSGGSALFSATPFTGGDVSWSTLSAGAAIAAYSFLGFDALTTLTEETQDPRRTIPRAILIVAATGGAFFVIAAYTTQLVSPGGTFADASAAASTIADDIGGALFSSFFVAGLIVAQFTSGLAAQASASRLLFAMGRDDVLPRRLLAHLHPRYATPIVTIGVVGVVGLIALFLDVATSTSFINFGAFTAFTLVNLSVIALFLRRRREGTTLSPLRYVVVPAVGAAVCLWLLTRLDSKAITLGLIWLGIGAAYLLVLTRGLRVPPPELRVDEEQPVAAAAPA